MLPACGGERRGTIGRQVRGVLREASDDPASARRNVTTQSALIRAADPQDVECLARAQRRHRPGHRARTDRGSGSTRRCGCRRRRFASGRRSAGIDRRDGAAARPRELGAIPLQTLQRFGASGLHAAAVRHEIGSARGFCSGLGCCALRSAAGRRRRCADARLNARSLARGRRRIGGLRGFSLNASSPGDADGHCRCRVRRYLTRPGRRQGAWHSRRRRSRRGNRAVRRRCGRAADGCSGVAAVTTGPGVTNIVTALRQLAQSPVVVLGGAAPSLLQGRGALQDIDQLSVTAPHAKFVERVRRVRDIGPAMELAFAAACDGVPGPAFVECAVDLLYDQATVRKWYGEAAGERRSIAARCGAFYVSSGISPNCMPPARRRRPSRYGRSQPDRAPPIDRRDHGQDLRQGVRPLIVLADRRVIGGQALAAVTDPASLAAAVTRLGIPAYLSGTARGLLGRDHALQLRHARRQAMQEADCIVLAGVGATSAWITAGTCPV